MKIEENFDLSHLNTFGVSALARFFVILNTEEDLEDLIKTKEFKENEKFFIGGGSNILFTKNFPGIVVLNKLKGIEIIKEDEEFCWIKSASGEIWSDLVNFTVNRELWGVENLSLIPGTVGAGPMQNIGAYGTELKETLEEVYVVDISTGEKKVFKNKECKFGYRDSIFKNEVKNKYFITGILLKLSKVPKPNLSYRVLKDYMKKNNLIPNSPRVISDAVINIRKSKLPDPKVICNAGSFFKNVFVSEEKLEELKKNYPDISFFEEDGMIKIPSGWLVESCGWKGKRIGNVGVHEKQALVIVNFGNASGKEIKQLAEDIILSVSLKFDLKLIPEVNIY